MADPPPLPRLQRERLVAALANAAFETAEQRQELLLGNLPPALQAQLGQTGQMSVDLNRIVRVAADWVNAADGTWALSQVIENAQRAIPNSQAAATLGAILQELTTPPIPGTVGRNPGLPIRLVAVTADGRWAVSWSNSATLTLWDLDPALAAPQPQAQPLTALPDVSALAPAVAGPTIFVVSESNKLTQWSVETRQPTRQAALPVHCVTALAADPDGQHLLAGTLAGTLVRLRLARRPTLVEPLFRGENNQVPHSSPVSAVLITRDRQVVSATRNSVRRWGLWTGTENPQHIILPNDWLIGVALLPGGNQIVYSNGESEVKIWDLNNSRTLFTLAVEAPAPLLPALAASADGRTIVAGRNDGALGVWRLPERRAPSAVPAAH